MIQENCNFFAICLHHGINTCLKDSQSPSKLKLAGVTHDCKKSQIHQRVTLDQ